MSISDEAVLAYLTAETYGDYDRAELTLEHWSNMAVSRARRGLSAAAGVLLAELGIQIVGRDPHGHPGIVFTDDPEQPGQDEPVEAPDWGDLITDEPGPAEPADEYQAVRS